MTVDIKRQVDHAARALRTGVSRVQVNPVKTRMPPVDRNDTFTRPPTRLIRRLRVLT